MIEKEVIQVPRDSIDKLAAQFHVGKTSVWRALSFNTLNKRSERIRQAALEKYGGIKTKKIIML